jgi:hypothetical protein
MALAGRLGSVWQKTVLYLPCPRAILKRVRSESAELLCSRGRDLPRHLQHDSLASTPVEDQAAAPVDVGHFRIEDLPMSPLLAHAAGCAQGDELAVPRGAQT